MWKLFKSRNLLILTVSIFLIPFVCQAADNPLDEILKKYPANNAADFEAVNAQLIGLGDSGLLDLCTRLKPSQENGDAPVRYALSGLTKYVQLQGDEERRQLVVNVFLKALNQIDDKEVKSFLIEQIQYIGNTEAIAPLSRYLTDAELCEPAAHALFCIKTPESSAALLFALQKSDDALKPAIIKTLGDLQSRAAALALIPYTESADLNTRLMAYYAIANIGDPSAANPLKRALTKTSGYEQKQAISAYLRFANRLAEAQAEELALTIYRTVLNTYTTAEDVNIQSAALTGLVAIEGEDALEDLLAAVDSPYKAYRNVALKLAQQIPGQKATWKWIDKSKSAAPEVRSEILAFLGERGDPIALPTLLEALNDSNSAVQMTAITASFHLGGLESVPFYTDLLRTEDESLINAVKGTLLQVPGSYLLTTVSYVLPTVPAPAKIALLDIIAQRKADLFFYDVLSFTEDENPAVRMAAIKALRDVTLFENVPDLITLLENTGGREAAETENAVYEVIDSFNTDQEKAEKLVQVFADAPSMKKNHLLNLLQRVRGQAALKEAAKYIKNPNLREEAAEAIVAIVCPQEGDGFGLRTNEAYALLEEALGLLKDRDLIEKAKNHLPSPLAEPDADGFVSLFNGKDMTGWVWNNSWKGSECGYSAQDGAIICDPAKGGGNIYTDREFSDFVFRFEFKLTPEANNGLGIRAPLSGDAAYAGMEIQILDHDHPSYNWIKPYQAHGSVYGTIPAKRGFLKPIGEWNEEEVKVDGRTIRVTLNGHVITEGHLDVARMPSTLDKHNHPGLTRTKGHIGFLGHGHHVEFRNMRIKELNKEPRPDNVPPEGFIALFNGEDLTNWKGLVANPVQRAKMSPEELAEAQKKADERMRAHWHPVDGVLVFDGKGDSLCTAKDYGDFELLVDWKIKEKGDSGIYLRGSPQVQIWDPQNFNLGSGGLYNNQKNPSQPLVNADHPIGEWNTFRIIMVGERVTIYLNDELVVDNTILENYWERDKPIYPTGSIELQNHGNTLYFKNIYVREL
ncbi:MAG: DUF1080 domain-containing protein [Candidatus Omnitrophica bacterium]|nr:DUF1080 domain-containing protein [Candidatus Omnitrophota bacterium]